MRRGVAFLTVAVLALAGGAIVSPASAHATSAGAPASNSTDTTAPTVNVTLNGDPVTDEEFRVLRDETTAVLRARIRAPSGRSLDTVLVQVGDEIVVDRETPGDSVTINRSLQIGAGNNTIRVVAEDSRDRLTSTRFLLYLERVPPAMDLERPVDTVPDPYQYEDVVTNRSLVTFAGRFRDLTGFRDAVVSFKHPSSGNAYRTFSVGPDPTFSERVLLEYPRTIVRVSPEDTLGNDHITSFDVRVRDERAPSIDLGFDETPIESPWYNVSATVEDNVWVDNVSVDVHYLGRTPYQEYNRHYTPVEHRTYEQSRDRLNVSFEQGVRLVQGRNIVSITARDHLGQTESRAFEVGYYPDTERPPTVDFLENATRIEGNDSAFVSAVVTDGDTDLRRVIVTVENLDRRQVTDVESFRMVNESTFLFEDTVNVTAGVSKVEIVAIDGQHNRTVERLYLDTRAERQTARPPPGYEDTANDSVSPGPTLPDDTNTPQTATPTDPATESPSNSTTSGETTTAPPENGGGDSGSDGGGEAATDDEDGTGDDAGSLLSLLTSLPVLALLGVVVIGGGYYVWIKLTRV